jgi:hypothetical protein
MCEPIFMKLEQFTGRGGMMGNMTRKFNYDDDEHMVPQFHTKQGKGNTNLIQLEEDLSNEIGKYIGNSSDDED